jgi:hypothetical protein
MIFGQFLCTTFLARFLKADNATTARASEEGNKARKIDISTSVVRLEYDNSGADVVEEK